MEDFLAKSSFFHKLGTKIVSVALLGQSFVPFSSLYTNIDISLPTPDSADLSFNYEPEKSLPDAQKSDIATAPASSTYTQPVSSSYPTASLNSFNLAADFSIENPTPVPNTTIDAGYGVNRVVNTTFLYGHSTLAFNPLKWLRAGSKIYITDRGESGYYTVEKTEDFEKADLSVYMSSLLTTSTYKGVKYDYILMTCGNGSNNDESHRFVLFLRAI